MRDPLRHPPPVREDLDADGYYRMKPHELVCTWVGGYERATGLPDFDGTPRQAFEAVLLSALCRTPCIIAFSGGRDSSAILAVATAVARREGLPDPVPVTHDFSGMGEADETAWQEMVVRHLGLRDWVRLTDLDAFDILGARAQAGLQQHGVLWPPMLHCHAALVDLAAGGGSLVTGQGGDEVLGLQRSAALAYMIKKRPRPTLPLVRHGLHAIAPVPVRRALQRRTADSGAASPWLAAEQALTTDVIMADDAAETPLDYRRSVVRHRRRRNVIAGQVNYGRVLADAQVDLVQPFYDAGFAAGLASSGGRLGHLSRTSLMRMLFSDVLPDIVLSRDTKARFGAVAVGETARQFMAEWNGEGVDPRVVDVEIFRQACLQPTPNFSVQALLQTAWLACHERRSAQR